MKWFDWIRSKKAYPSEIPDCRPLKRGEIKQILIQLANESIPGFAFLEYRGRFYVFQRIRQFSRYNVYELINIGFTLKRGAFSCSIASRIDPRLVGSNLYDTGLLNPHTSLIPLKLGSGIIPIEDAYYYHNGMLETCRRIASEIFEDIRDSGIPFFDRQMTMLTTNPTIKAGLDFIEQLEPNDLDLIAESVKMDYEQFQYLKTTTQVPIYIELKRRMQAVPGESRRFRKRIPGAATQLIQLAMYLREMERNRSNPVD